MEEGKEGGRGISGIMAKINNIFTFSLNIHCPADLGKESKPMIEI